jgi:hypothetical protein
MSIFSTNDRSNNNESIVTHYTVLDNSSELDNDSNPITSDESKSFAKKVYNGQFSFYIKTGPNGRIYNPIGMFSEGNHNKFLAKLGKPEWKYTKVNQKVFDMYLNFLRTKNVAWLNTAQRELT